MSADRRRLALALLLSLLLHAPLLSLTFGGQGFGLPGFNFPWRERRIEVPDLRVVLVPAQVTASEPAGTPANAPLQQASIAQTVAGGPTLTPFVASAPVLRETAEAIVQKGEVESKPDTATAAVPAKTLLRTDEAVLTAPAAPLAVPAVIAVAPSEMKPAFVMPVPQDAGEAAQKPAELEVREQSVEVPKPDSPASEAQQERQRQADQLAAARVEAQRLEAARVEAQRLEAARIEASRLDAARLEVQRQETARLAAAKLEAQRQEVARLTAVRIEAARVEAARLETDRQAAVRQAAAAQEAAHVKEEKEEDLGREARRQAMGRQLNEEAAKREAAARSSSTLPLSLSTARRARLWGRTDPNDELAQYAEAWARRIQFNTPGDTVRDVAKRPHTNPMVTVAIRSDGSVESVTFAVSSGVAEVDEAIRRIVQSHTPNPRFLPGLASEYDVIEVRRTWHFDTAIRIY